MTSLYPTPHSPSWSSRIVSGGLEIVDTQLEKASLYVEQLNHALRPVPKQTELIDFIDNPDLRLSLGSRLIETIREQIHKGLPVTLSLQNAAAIVNALSANLAGGLDDRKMLLEYVLVFLSRLPSNSPFSKTLSDKVITLLYNDLPHPPAALVGSKYRFRSADGSGNNVYKPDMGKAGSHYARSVQGQHPLPQTELPSASLIFDALLKRETQAEHPSGLSSHFFAFANLVIHSLFHTDHFEGEEAINKTSSYLDLSIIYGNNQDEQNSVRLFDGTGRLQPDTFADGRLLQMPPSTPALCVLFSRNHNYIATKLLAINEQGRWNRNFEGLNKVAKKKQDEEIFQTSRLINCGWFMNTILSDYLSAILGLVREGNSWSLDPLQTFRDSDHKISERGQGNIVSIEFTALYHFHASISSGDEKWAEGSISRLFPGKSFDDISVEDYKEKINQLPSHPSTPPNSWTFGGLVRKKDGTFPDEGLARILQNATEEPAGAFGARRTPHALKIVEIMSIEHNREWGTCTLNAFRSFLGLKPYSTFEEWNPRPDIADAARRLYGHPDNLELYVGLQAEDTKPPIPGAGLCPGYTTSRAILADAVALVRGDRYLTTDYTVANLTSWGINDAKRNPKNPAFGGMLPGLFMRTLPNHYDPKSVYTQFPLMTPRSMKKCLGNINLAHKYSFDRPVPLPVMQPFKSAYDVRAALTNPNLHSLIPLLARDISPGVTYLTSFNRPELHREYRNHLYQAFAGSAASSHTKYLAKLSAQLIRSKSYSVTGLGKNFVDIVKDVIQPLGVQFASTFVLGIALKSKTSPHGAYFEGKIYQKLKSIYDYVFSLNPTSSAISILDQAREAASELVQHVRRHFRAIEGGLIPFASLYDKAVHVITGSPHEAHDFLSRLLKRQRDRDDLAFDAVVLAALLVVEFPQGMSRIWPDRFNVQIKLIDAFLPKVVALVSSGSNTTFATLKEVVLEAIRLAPPVPGVVREALCDIKINGKPIKQGGRVFVSLVDAAYDPCFENPDNIVTPSRAKDLVDDGLLRLLGPDWIAEAALPVIKNIFSLGGLSRFPGSLGHLSGLKSEIPGGTKIREYLAQSQHITTTPSKLLLGYTNGASISTSPTSTSTLRPNCPPLPVDWSSTPTNASDGSDSAQTPSKGGSEASGGDATGLKPSSGTGNTGKQPQLASPVDYKPEFVGGVGGGANDPDYEYQTGKEQSSKGVDTSEQGPEDIWKPDLPPHQPPPTSQPPPDDGEEVFNPWRPDLPSREFPATTQPKPEETGEVFEPWRPDLPSREDTSKGEEVFKPWRPDVPPYEPPATTQPKPDETGEVFKPWRPDLPSREDPTKGVEVFKPWRPDIPPYEPPATTQPKPEESEVVFQPWRPDLPTREDPSKRTNTEDTSVTPNVREPSRGDQSAQESGQNKPKDQETANGATSQSPSKPSDNDAQAVQTEKDQGVPTAVPVRPSSEEGPVGNVTGSISLQNGNVTSGGNQKPSEDAGDQTQDPSKTETATLPSQPEKTTQPDKPVDQTPLPPQHEPSGFTHTTPVGNLRKGTAWDDYTFPPKPSEATITVVKVFHDAGGLRAIQTSFSGKWAPKHGAADTTSYREDNLYLQRGENIVRVEGRESDQIVTAMQLFTSTGRKSSLFGSTTVGKPFSWEGNVLRYFSGTEDNTGVTALRGHFT
ncbi:hypothetical protein FS837_009101 [Tulasnella sp. UAMH 9824]|nr:hypothetical protein FS837_009101 [Tulasnella sp. UAMH 9824]